MKPSKSERDHIKEARAKLLAAIDPHVIFDGWSDIAFQAAIVDAGLDRDLAVQACPRGVLDLAIFYHKSGDAALQKVLDQEMPTDLRIREKIAFAVRARLRGRDKEVIRRAVTFFSLPQNLTTGTKLIWETSDLIWNALGDPSQDLNWYTKRAMLSGVYSATLLFWLDDHSPEETETWAFLDRRIENVMQIEIAKSRLRETPLGPVIDHISGFWHKPDPQFKEEMPGFRRHRA